MGSFLGSRQVATVTYNNQAAEHQNESMKIRPACASLEGACVFSKGADVFYQETSADGLPGRQWGRNG